MLTAHVPIILWEKILEKKKNINDKIIFLVSAFYSNKIDRFSITQRKVVEYFLKAT